MSYNVKTIEVFERQARRLSKKYPSLKKELLDLVLQLKQNPELGFPLGNHCFKIRLSISSKGKGKSGGARVITHIYIGQKTVFLLSIYDKSEKSDLSNKELASLLRFIQ